MDLKSKKGSENSSNVASQKGASATDRLPFEPIQTRKKTPKKSAPVAKAIDPPKEKLPKSSTQTTSGIPEVVSRRMARRMGYFCGIPTSFGVLSFAIAYIVVTQGWLKIPNVIVVLVSMGGFGLGVLGLSYGVISASWDEERVGSLLGWEEFTTNLGRLIQAWRESKATKQKPSP